MHKSFLILGAGLAALPLLSAGAALPADDAVSKGSTYIHSNLQADGSYGATSPGQNMDSILAVRAAGYDPAKDRLPGGLSPADYFTSNAAAVSGGAGAAKAALAAKALGLDPSSAGGRNLIAAVTDAIDGATGRYGEDDFSQSIAMLGLACTGHSVDAAAVAALKDAQLDDGGWGFGGAPDPDTTAIALQALLAAGVAKTDASVTGALHYVKAAQADDGGWGFDPSASNTSSTAFVIQALLAVGEDPESAAYAKGSNTPITYLLSQQAADGSFAGFDPLFATNQVVPALAGRTFCNAADTPVTRQREQSDPTATATATPSPSPTATAPAPPATGTGQASEGLTPERVALIALATALMAGSAGVALRRR